ncbi:molybdopterin converting factor subunit 1 [Limibacillus halophilus]|jgi:molybdopterin synthase sulfur carrier subunit
MKLLYFAWLRQRIGVGEEEIELPAGIATVGDLIDWLAARGPNYAAALEQREKLRVAVNQEYAQADDPVKAGDEVALFPPVTGG